MVLISAFGTFVGSLIGCWIANTFFNWRDAGRIEKLEERINCLEGRIYVADKTLRNNDDWIINLIKLLMIEMGIDSAEFREKYKIPDQLLKLEPLQKIDVTSVTSKEPEYVYGTLI